MATRHASAMKAHRQTIKRTAHNRELRSKLRTGAEGDSQRDRRRARRTRRRPRSARRYSLIDKMSGKGIIHDNAAGRYKSRLRRERLAK